MQIRIRVCESNLGLGTLQGYCNYSKTNLINAVYLELRLTLKEIKHVKEWKCTISSPKES